MTGSTQSSVEVASSQKNSPTWEFVDSPPVPHSVLSVGTRVYLSKGVALGPAFTLMPGPGIDRDTFITGNVTFDVLVPELARPVHVVP